MSENKMETVTLSKARHDAVWKELNALRELRRLARNDMSSMPNRYALSAWTDHCVAMEHLTWQSEQSEAVSKVAVMVFDEITTGTRVKPRTYIGTAPKLDYDKMPHDFEARARIDGMCRNVEKFKEAMKHVEECDGEVLVFGVPLPEVKKCIDYVKGSDSVMQLVLRELESSRAWIDVYDTFLNGKSGDKAIGYSKPPKREVTIQRKLPPRDGDHFIYSASLRK